MGRDDGSELGCFVGAGLGNGLGRLVGLSEGNGTGTWVGSRLTSAKPWQIIGSKQKLMKKNAKSNCLLKWLAAAHMRRDPISCSQLDHTPKNTVRVRILLRYVLLQRLIPLQFFFFNVCQVKKIAQQMAKQIILFLSLVICVSGFVEYSSRSITSAVQKRHETRALTMENEPASKRRLISSPWRNKQDAIANKERRTPTKVVKRRELIAINQEMLKQSRVDG